LAQRLPLEGKQEGFMKQRKGHSLIGWLGLTLGTLALALSFSPPQLLPGLLAKMEQANRNLKSLRAVIEQQHVNTQIGTKDTDFGTLLYKPGHLRIDYVKPTAQSISVIGDAFVLYQPRINQALKTTIAKVSKGRTSGFTQIVGLNSSLKSLADQFVIEYVKDEAVGEQMATQLRLTPKAKGGSLASIELWVNQQTWLPVMHKFTERNGDYTIVKLTKLELNPKLDDLAFVIKLPGNTVVVDKMEE
jgi:outer membrane lipoprotein-sorting protein